MAGVFRSGGFPFFGDGRGLSEDFVTPFLSIFQGGFEKNVEKRKIYDKFGLEGLAQGGGTGHSGGILKEIPRFF